MQLEASLTVATAGIVFARSSTFLAARTMSYVWQSTLRIMLLPLQVERSAKAQRYIAGINGCDESEANPQPCIMCRRKIINAGIARVVGRVNGKPKDLVLT